MLLWKYNSRNFREPIPKGKEPGYEMSTTVTISNIPIEEAGDLMTLSTENGANKIRGLQFKTTEYDEAYSEAVKKALSNSREKAEALAEAAGCKIVGIQNVVNNSRYSPYKAVVESYTIDNNNQAEKASGVKGFSGTATDVQGGELDIDAKVSVIYIIEDIN